MANNFILDAKLEQNSCGTIELDLCKLLLVNNALFPWVILVPKQNNIKEIIDLSEQDQQLLMKEISKISKMLQELFSPDKLNIAALGNIVPQLHVHVIARYKNDASWPDPVFGGKSEEYSIEKSTEIISKFKEFLNVR